MLEQIAQLQEELAPFEGVDNPPAWVEGWRARLASLTQQLLVAR
jgi:hypothetical protein